MDTKHDKIIRFIDIFVYIVKYCQEDSVDAVIEEMRSDRDPAMSYGAQYVISLAYCGTGSNKAVCILLHTYVSYVRDDVCMFSVVGLDFLLYKTPDWLPQIVKLMLDSFNRHVQYASFV